MELRLQYRRLQKIFQVQILFKKGSEKVCGIQNDKVCSSGIFMIKRNR